MRNDEYVDGINPKGTLPVTRLHNVSVETFDQFKRVLAEADLDAELIEEIIHKPELAREWVIELRKKLAPLSHLDMFESVEAVYEAFLDRLEKRNWEIGLLAKNNLFKKVKNLKGFDCDLQNVFSLDIWLGDLLTTITELQLWIGDVHCFKQLPQLVLDAEHIQLANVVQQTGRYGTQPFVRAVSLDLLANTGKALRSLQGAFVGGFDAMTAFAVHKSYPRHIDHYSIPSVVLGAFQCSSSTPGDLRDVPLMRWDRLTRSVQIGTYWSDKPYEGYSVPQVTEL